MNPTVKTAIVLVLGAVAATVDAFANGTGPNSVVSYVATHPQAALAATVVGLFAHNLLSEISPPASVVTK